MFEDYIHRFYDKLANRSEILLANGFAKAKEIAAWKENVAENWDSIEVVSFKFDDSVLKGVEIGDTVKAYVILDKHGIKGSLGIEIVRLHADPVTKTERIRAFKMSLDKTEGSKVYYSSEIKASEAGPFKFGVRIYPDNSDLPHRMDFAYVKWINF
jgi:starch phosphorylase